MSRRNTAHITGPGAHATAHSVHHIGAGEAVVWWWRWWGRRLVHTHSGAGKARDRSHKTNRCTGIGPVAVVGWNGPPRHRWRKDRKRRHQGGGAHVPAAVGSKLSAFQTGFPKSPKIGGPTAATRRRPCRWPGGGTRRESGQSSVQPGRDVPGPAAP